MQPLAITFLSKVAFYKFNDGFIFILVDGRAVGLSCSSKTNKLNKLQKRPPRLLVYNVYGFYCNNIKNL